MWSKLCLIWCTFLQERFSKVSQRNTDFFNAFDNFGYTFFCFFVETLSDLGQKTEKGIVSGTSIGIALQSSLTLIAARRSVICTPAFRLTMRRATALRKFHRQLGLPRGSASGYRSASFQACHEKEGWSFRLCSQKALRYLWRTKGFVWRQLTASEAGPWSVFLNHHDLKEAFRTDVKRVRVFGVVHVSTVMNINCHF